MTAEIDEAQMQQVLTNLVVNAIQAMPQGGRLMLPAGARAAPLRRRTSVATPADYVTRHASTTRERASPPSILPHIFEPFFTTKDVGEAPASGSPSPTASCASTAAGSTSRAEPGEGSRFTIFLRPRPSRRCARRSRERARPDRRRRSRACASCSRPGCAARGFAVDSRTDPTEALAVLPRGGLRRRRHRPQHARHERARAVRAHRREPARRPGHRPHRLRQPRDGGRGDPRRRLRLHHQARSRSTRSRSRSSARSSTARCARR